LDKIEQDTNGGLRRNDPVKRKFGASKADGGMVKSASDFKVYLVRGENFRCLAYMNKGGKWVNLFTKEKLPKVIQVLPVV
jgi:hypothetical protein